MSDKKKTLTTPAAPQKKVYLGPGFRGVARGTIYDGDIPQYLQDEISALPALGSLIVPVDRLVEASKELATEGSRLKGIFDYVCKVKKGA